MQADSAAIQFGRQIESRFGGPQNRLFNRITLLGPVWGSEVHCLVTPGEAGGPAVGGLVRIIWFVGQLRLLVRPRDALG